MNSSIVTFFDVLHGLIGLRAVEQLEGMDHFIVDFQRVGYFGLI